MSTYFTSFSGVKIPKLIYGTAWKESRTSDLVELALSLGFRGIDTACQPRHYKEPLVGEGIERAYVKGLKREELFIQTKFTSVEGQDPDDIPYDPSGTLENQILTSFEVSKKNLKTSYIDSLVLHSPLDTLERTLHAWQTMESIVDTGELKQLGISNCYDINLLKTIYQKARIKPSVLQNRFYPETGYDTELREFCCENNIFYQCFWTLGANPHILNSPSVNEIAKQKGKTAAEIYFRCLNHLNIFPLFGTTSKTHMIEDLAIYDFSLSEQECNKIRATGPF